MAIQSKHLQHIRGRNFLTEFGCTYLSTSKPARLFWTAMSVLVLMPMPGANAAIMAGVRSVITCLVMNIPCHVHALVRKVTGTPVVDIGISRSGLCRTQSSASFR
eukprot:1145503-Pelagomonas_calceolata.AAC.4